MSKVYVKFPKTGLGNLLLVWARASVFAHLNNLPLVTSPWWGFRLGTWLRNEKKKRLYWGYFIENSIWDRLKARFYGATHEIVHEPPVKKMDMQEESVNKLFIFDQVIADNDLFGAVSNYQSLLKANLYRILNPRLKRQLDQYEAPIISVHIRRGDFKLGNPITPEEFFVECINMIRQFAKEDWPVTIFTDASVNEIQQVLSLPNTTLTSPKPDILDILLMSQSNLIITSKSSTFSYWAAFLSEAIVIRHEDDWQHSIRHNPTGDNYSEIKWSSDKKKSTKELEEKIRSLNKN